MEKAATQEELSPESSSAEPPPYNDPDVFAVRAQGQDLTFYPAGKDRLERLVRLIDEAETTVKPKILHESLVQSLQRVLPDEEDEADEIGSLSQSAEAMRLSAAAPARSTSMGGDYDA